MGFCFGMKWAESSEKVQKEANHYAKTDQGPKKEIVVVVPTRCGAKESEKKCDKNYIHIHVLNFSIYDSKLADT